MRTRRAFTAIELLVVIGIIITLAAILFVGMKAIQNNSRRRATETALKNCQSMLAELDAKTRLGSGSFPGAWLWWEGGPVVTGAGNGLNYWNRPYPVIPPPTVPPSPPPPPDPLDSPGLVKADAGNLFTRNASRGVVNTSVIMGVLAALPANRTMMSSFPQDQVFVPDWLGAGSFESAGTDGAWGSGELSSPRPTEPAQYVVGARVRVPATGKIYRCLVSHQATGTSPDSDTTNWAEDTAPAKMMKDGWGNPIIFVPASGLRVLLLNGKSDYDGSAQQQYIVVSPEGRVNGNGTATPVIQTAGRPFFASAGPDGDFSKGDDNVYSFEQ